MADADRYYTLDEARKLWAVEPFRVFVDEGGAPYKLGADGIESTGLHGYPRDVHFDETLRLTLLHMTEESRADLLRRTPDALKEKCRNMVTRTHKSGTGMSRLEAVVVALESSDDYDPDEPNNSL